MMMHGYEVQIALVHRDYAHRRDHQTLFAAPSDQVAVQDGIRFAQHQLRAWNRFVFQPDAWIIGSVMVSRLNIPTPDANGYIPNGRSDPFFHWQSETSERSLETLLTSPHHNLQPRGDEHAVILTQSPE